MIKHHYLPPEVKEFGISGLRLLLQASVSDPEFGYFEGVSDSGSLSESETWED